MPPPINRVEMNKLIKETHRWKTKQEKLRREAKLASNIDLQDNQGLAGDITEDASLIIPLIDETSRINSRNGDLQGTGQNVELAYQPVSSNNQYDADITNSHSILEGYETLISQNRSRQCNIDQRVDRLNEINQNQLSVFARI